MKTNLKSAHCVTKFDKSKVQRLVNVVNLEVSQKRTQSERSLSKSDFISASKLFTCKFLGLQQLLFKASIESVD